MKLGKALHMKKWWVLAVVVTLALSLTSCSSKKRNLLGYEAYSECVGDRWSFEAVVQADGNGYALIIYPTGAIDEGDIVQVVLSTVNGTPYDIVKYQIPFYTGRQIVIRGLSIEDFENYEAIAVIPFDPSTDYPTVVAEGDEGTFCALPYPGDGSAQEEAY